MSGAEGPRRPSAPPPPPRPTPVWLDAMVTSSGMRRLLERPRSAFLRRRAGRRGLVVLHLAVTVGFLVAQHLAADRTGTSGVGTVALMFGLLLLLFLLLSSVLHGVSWGIAQVGRSAVDEREQQLRDRAQRRAHWLSVVGLLVGSVALQVRIGLDRIVTLDRATILAVTLGATVLVAFMPAYVLAWTRDADDPDDGPERGGHDAR